MVASCGDYLLSSFVLLSSLVLLFLLFAFFLCLLSSLFALGSFLKNTTQHGRLRPIHYTSRTEHTQFLHAVCIVCSNGRTPGGEPRHKARTTKTNIECKTNDDVPERGYHHNLRLNFCITEHGWIGAGGGPVEDFLCLGLRACFRISVLLLLLMLISFYTGHSLRAPSCMNNK